MNATRCSGARVVRRPPGRLARSTRLALLSLSAAILVSTDLRSEDAVASGGIVAHPDELVFEDLKFTPPSREKHRHVLPSGLVVYVVEDRSLPLVDFEVRIRAGDYLDPDGKEGLFGALGSLLRSGGTESLPPDELDEELDFLAAQVSTRFGAESGEASFNCLTKDLDRVLELFVEILRRPRLDEERFEVWRRAVLQDLARRNDATASIESREWSVLLDGPDDPRGDHRTRASIESLSREDLLRAHARHVHPRNFIVAISGDIETGAALARIEGAFESWAPPGPEEEGPNVVPQLGTPAEPGVYIVDKPEVNQGRVRMGHRGVRRGHPDQPALVLANHILGGGGFTSRITSRVRSDEGLAYTARSQYEAGAMTEGEFRVFFQSKNRSVAQAAAIVLEEIERIRTEDVAEKELADAISYLVNVFPRYFASASAVASRFADDELTGRDPDFWSSYRERVRAVTVADVRRVAREHLHPEKLVILVVGGAQEVLEGNPDRPAFSVVHLGQREPQRIVLPDPETLERRKS